MNRLRPEVPKMLTTAEVARIFEVNPRTVAKWAQRGRLPWIKTLGGHRRFYEDDVWNLYGSL